MFDPAALPTDERWHFYRRTSLAALCLLLVAGLHLWRVRSYDQTRWKGGGFGMFSTVDAESARFLKIYLQTADGQEFAVGLPESLEKRAAVLRALPDQSLADDLAKRIAQLRFEREEGTWIDALAKNSFPKTMSANDLPQSPALPAPALLPRGELSDWRPVPVAAGPKAGWQPSKVRVELWRHIYDGERKQLRVVPILQATHAAEPAAPGEPS